MEENHGNSFLLCIVGEGYSIQFISKTLVNTPVISNPSLAERILALKQQIANHLETGAFEKLRNPLISLYPESSLKKSNGDDRLIIHLSLLNNFILKTQFRLEKHAIIKSLIQKNDYLSSIDLLDAFFSIPLHVSSKKFVMFEFENVCYCYNVFPLGLTSSPRIFFKMLKPVISSLRAEGIKISSYLDDIFLCCSSASCLKFQITSTLNLLISLGFTPNYKKISSLTFSRDYSLRIYLEFSSDDNISS